LFLPCKWDKQAQFRLKMGRCPINYTNLYRIIHVFTKLGVGKVTAIVHDSGLPDKQIQFNHGTGSSTKGGSPKTTNWLANHLNKLGAEGWELVAAFSVSATAGGGGPITPWQYYTLKRPK
jgi:hypothetical protein